MTDKKQRRQPRPVPVGREELGLWRVGLRRYDLGDPYHLAISLSWPAFTLTMIALWLALNLIFALLYTLDPGSVANARPGSFTDAFFFSIETLATVGYGVMAPASLYGHIVDSIELLTGMAFTAIVTGILFVRFARPTPKFMFADNMVVSTHNCAPTLMIRVGNGRLSVMHSATARLYVLRGEYTQEGKYFRRIHELRVTQSHLPIFIMPWTVMHPLDDSSPLAGLNAETLKTMDVRLVFTLAATDQTLGATVQDMMDYLPARIKFGVHYADSVHISEDGHTTADLSLLSTTEPD
jgi:inward rectifier potassium channel